MDQSQHSVSSSSEKYRTKASDLSPFNPNQRIGDVLGAREPVANVGNIEVHDASHMIIVGWKFNFINHIEYNQSQILDSFSSI